MQLILPNLNMQPNRAPMCWSILWFFLASSLIIWPINGIQISSQCPHKCDCVKTLVNCDNRNLNSIPYNLPTWSEVLIMTNNPIVSLPNAQFNRPIKSPQNLTSIDFSNTQLQFIDLDILSTLFDEFDYIDHSLDTLHFDANFLTILPLLTGANHLRTLTLSKNYLKYESITDLDLSSTYPILEYLDLSDNYIKIIPKNFLCQSQPNSNLSSLLLHNNEIEVIEDGAFEQFLNLKILRLSKNNIKVISKDWLRNLPHLKELDLNFNNIDQIDILAFDGLKSLQTLRLRRNKLENLSDGSFWGLSKLQKLHLDHNSITDIRLGWTFGLKSLKELSIRHNSIEEIQDGSWNSASKLLELHLSHNKLQRINKETFSKLTLLKVLKMSNNRVSYIDENSFHSLKSLDILDLASNKLSWTIESSNGFFTNLESLKKLRLDNNQIRLIFKHTFSGLSNLTMLNLTGNPISSIQSDSFVWFENLKDLFLENTDLLCDCTMKWFFEWLQTSETRAKFARKIRCKHPKELFVRTATSFLSADISEFKCHDFLKPYLLDDFHNISKPMAAIKNKNITFYCKVATSSSDEVQFKWLKDNQIIDHNRAHFTTLAQEYNANVTHFTNVFTLEDVQDEDQGKYHCMASNNFGSVYSHKFKVNVYVVPYFLKKPQNITVKVGHTARLECAAKGQPAPIISWQKDGGDSFPAAMERRMHVMPSDDVFFIVEVKKSDMGSYSCNATNEAGSIVSTAYLNVIELPSFVRKMTDKQSFVESTVTLECMAAGFPMPQITWYKDGHVLDKNPQKYFFTAEGQLLILFNLRASDQGRYFCNISNMYGSAQDSLYLNVLNYNHKKNPDLLNRFLELMRTHGVIFIIIILCVVFTSVAWIFVICYIGQRDKPYTKGTVEDIENYAEQDDNESNNFDVDQNDLFRSINNRHFYDSKPDIELDTSSETSSARDTGIEGSCKSNEDDSDHAYSFDPHSYQIHCSYRSLPRRSYNAKCAPHISSSHSSLPRKNNIRVAQHYDPNVLYNDQSVRNLSLSSKKKKLILKKIKYNQMCNSKMLQNVETANVGLPISHQNVCQAPNRPQILRTFSTTDISHI